MMMNGLTLSEAYFLKHGLPMLEHEFKDCMGRIAAGLVGEGSDCYGFDDKFSRDHDWGPGFCLWLTAEDYCEIGPRLRTAYLNLPDHFNGYHAKAYNPLCSDRIGVLNISDFYRQIIGLDRIPETLDEWRIIPEQNLSIATNGRVFHDPLGAFTSIREGLLAYYPEDIRLKKIAARCMTAAQSGQYNYLRCLRHGEPVAAHVALSLFAESVISLVFLLNNAYKPFYKWMHRAMKSLPILGATVYDLLLDLTAEQNPRQLDRVDKNITIIEEICRLIILELGEQGLSHVNSDFLFDHGPAVQMLVSDERIRNLDVMSDC